MLYQIVMLHFFWNEMKWGRKLGMNLTTLKGETSSGILVWFKMRSGSTVAF